MVRVVAGTARGMKLNTRDSEETKPTLDRVKEAMFSMLTPYLPGALVLDLFAGCGGLGIEALSRGALECVFSDKSKECCDIIKGNLVKTGFSERAFVRRNDFTGTINDFDSREKFHIILLDPPYLKGLEREAIKLISSKKIYAPGAVIMAEHSMEDVMPDEIGNFVKEKDKKYGTVGVAVYVEKEQVNG
ncbi:MAG: 16S rRNA (guanine(966)-N(2))-methyltransferase RsmD [Ruminococcaceae bacterium]|nr:16S rRNA (guanine(966)-N(2))-methyltransferase RsmD [Oscillospiraceae bacterium]